MRKNIIPITIITTVISSIIFNLSLSTIYSSANVSAVSYQSSNNIQFNLNPTISISITGGDLSIANLVPGSVSDSNTIDVTVASNAISGYTLTSTVGATGNLSNELRRNGIDTTNKFTNLTANQSTLSNFSDNEWGYSYSTDNGSTWISGNTGNTNTGYNGYTYTTESETITHLSTSTPDSTTIKYKIGAKASNTQLAGNYTNTINFTAITKANPEVLDKTFDEAFLAAGKTKYNGYYTMQDMDNIICREVKFNETTQLIDTRDDTVYYIGKAKDNNCWMLQNLKLGKKSTTLSLTSDTSNVSADGFTLDGKLTDGKFHKYTVDDVPNQNNSSEYYCTDDYGCYYNWYTATASSGTTQVSGGNVDYSICPASWALPTVGSGGQFSALYARYPSVSQMLVYNPTTTIDNLTGEITGFLLGGYYYSGGFNSGGGYYWSRTAFPYGLQSAFYLELSASNVNTTQAGFKYYGFSLRCLAQ